MSVLKNLLLPCSLLMLVSNLGVAQDLPKPRDFYQKDYAEGPLAGSTIPHKGSSRSEETPGSSATPRAPMIENSDSEMDSARESILDEDAGLAVLEVGAILNSDDAEHYRDVLLELADVAREHDFKIGRIETIGDMRNLGQHLPESLKLLARGATIHAKSRPPEKYKNIKKSPTWIVRTDQGEVLLEGVRPLARVFSRKGKLIFERIPGSEIELTQPTQ